MLLNYQSDHAPNITDPPTRAHIVLGIVLPLYALTLLMVGARILVKTKLGKLGVDDLLVGISMTLAVGVMVCTIIACRFGFGMHVSDFRPEWQLRYGKIFYSAVLLCSPCLFITKTSMICFYLHLAPHPTFRIICYLSITGMTVCWTAIFLVNMFGCAPIAGGWNRTPDFPSKCITTPAFYRFTVLCNIVTDVLVMLLPIPILMRMQLQLKKKLGLVAMFSMGFLTTAVDVMCLNTVNIAINSTDIIWDGAYTWVWALLELNFGIMTACMPAMTLFWRWVKGQYRGGDVLGAGGGGVHGSTIGGGASKRVPKMGVLSSASSERMVGEAYVLNDVGGFMADGGRDESRV